MLTVLKLDVDSVTPTLSHPGQDIGYDLYAIETTIFPPGAMKRVRTGIAIEFIPAAGALVGCRSGLAAKGFSVEAGWIDAGYRGELVVLLRNNSECTLRIDKGDRCAQFRRVNVARDLVVETDSLTPSERGANGFGSTGK